MIEDIKRGLAGPGATVSACIEEIARLRSRLKATEVVSQAWLRWHEAGCPKEGETFKALAAVGDTVI